MTKAIDMFADTLQGILDRGVEVPNDFVGLAIAGEHLRRRAHADMLPEEVNIPALTAYDEFLKNFLGDAPRDLEKDQAEILTDLIYYARESRITRDWEAGKQLLDDLDATLCVAAALTRSGGWSVERLKNLATRTYRAVHGLCCSLLDLAQYAEDHTLIYAGDYDFWDPEWDSWDVYSFWEGLAWCASTRIEIQVAMSQYSKRQCRIEEAIRKYEENGR